MRGARQPTTQDVPAAALPKLALTNQVRSRQLRGTNSGKNVEVQPTAQLAGTAARLNTAAWLESAGDLATAPNGWRFWVPRRRRAGGSASTRC